MAENVEYETPISCMMRLTRGDMSDVFIFRLKFPKDKKSDIEIRTTINKARVISKKIDDIIKVDPTLNEYEITLFGDEKNNNLRKFDTNEIASIFSNLLKSTEEKITVSEDEKKKIEYLRFLIGETKNDGLNIEFQSIPESISYLRTNYHDECIEFLSSRLQEMIDGGEFFNLEESIANEIIDLYFAKHQIRIQKNDEKAESVSKEEIVKIFEGMRDQEEETVVMHFLLQVEYCHYTKEMREYIISHLSDDIVYNELGQIIKQYRYQLDNIEIEDEKENGASNAINIEFKGDELNGIISYLKNAKGELKITSGCSFYGSLKNIIKYDEDNINKYFQNHNGARKLNESEGFLQFDFVDHKVNLTSYTLRTSQQSQNGTYHPKSWRVLGSNDRSNWDVISKQTNNSSLNGRYKQHRFDCEPNKNYYQYIRYLQDDSWHPNREYHFWLTCVEFFGSISTK